MEESGIIKGTDTRARSGARVEEQPAVAGGGGGRGGTPMVPPTSIAQVDRVDRIDHGDQSSSAQVMSSGKKESAAKKPRKRSGTSKARRARNPGNDGQQQADRLNHRRVPADDSISVPTMLSEWDLSHITGDEATQLMEICDKKRTELAAFCGRSLWFIRSRKFLGAGQAYVRLNWVRSLRTFVGEHDYRIALEEIREKKAHVPEGSNVDELHTNHKRGAQ